MIKFISLILLLIVSNVGFSQKSSYEPIHVNSQLKKVIKIEVLMELETLFQQIAQGNVDPSLITAKNSQLTLAILNGLNGTENEGRTGTKNHYKKQLIKYYSISKQEFSVSIAFISHGTQRNLPIIKTIINLIITDDKNEVKFSLPLNHITKNWKSTSIGNIHYIYKDSIVLERAHLFARKNIIIAKKMKVPVENFYFYMCANYQEILHLLGLEYRKESSNTTRDGYGVEAGYIFSIMNNEDFSHDVFHYYSGKINQAANRNWIAEEGIACSWGNAYYTDQFGEMINFDQLITELTMYIKDNPNANLLDLFEKDIKIYNHIAPELSVRSVISGILINEIERRKGLAGIQEMINSGKKPNQFDAFYLILDHLIHINRSNFNKKVGRLLSKH